MSPSKNKKKFLNNLGCCFDEGLKFSFHLEAHQAMNNGSIKI